PARLPSRLEDHCQVLRLRRTDDVHETGAAELARAVTNRGEVGCRVPVATVALPDDQRLGLAVATGEAGGEGAQRARVNAGQTLLLELAGDVVEHRVVEALAAVVVGRECHPEALVDDAEVALRLLDQEAPPRERVLVSALQRDDAPAGPVGEGPVALELLVGLPVE